MMYHNNNTSQSINNSTQSAKVPIWNWPSYAIDYALQTMFYYIGFGVAKAPIIVVLLSVLVTAGFSVGITKIHFETNPQKLWVPDKSSTVEQKNAFDSSFSPFYRIEQLIVVPKDGGNVIDKDILLELGQLEKEIQAIQLVKQVNGSELQMKTLNDLCYTPIPSKGCVIQSPFQYWQNSLEKLEADTDVSKHIFECAFSDKGLSSVCMSDIGIPLYYKQVIGGAVANQAAGNCTARALLVTYLLNNRPEDEDWALDWEKQFLEIAAKPRQYASFYYSAQRSVEDELAKDNGDIKTIAISYLCMFIYVALSLGQLHPVKSRLLLGFAGILIVIMSVLISAGICCLIGIKATLIISEVIPFLILAIGVDNMFIMANTIDEIEDGKIPIPALLGKTMSKIGTSMFLASISEFLAFMLGSLTKMPAVQAFCFYAGFAILANFLLQITAFAALLSLDMRRRRSNRMEIEPTIQLPSIQKDWISNQKLVKLFMEKVYARVIVLLPVSIIIVIVFMITTGLSIYAATTLEQGLDQATALPSTSYQVDFFKMQREYIDVGPPVYFVVNGTQVDHTAPETQEALFKSFDYITRTPYVEKGSATFWLDDFRQYVNQPLCSGVDIGSQVIPSENFIPWLQQFLAQEQCCMIYGQMTSLCGFRYRQDVKISADNKTIEASRLWVLTTTLRTQDDFINSMKAAFYTTDTLLDKELSLPGSFPYSIYYVYFAQYMYLPTVAATNILIATAAVVGTTIILLASPISSIYILVVLFMIDVHLMALMAIWKIYLNALSVVNLVMSIGISVEFCIHLTKAFLNAKGSHQERTFNALVNMGSSVFSGITVTKLIGVLVLNFAQSEIFRIYYFRMYFGIVLLGAAHGLIFLPALLRLVGPSSNSSTELSSIPSKSSKEIDEEEEQDNGDL